MEMAACDSLAIVLVGCTCQEFRMCPSGGYTAQVLNLLLDMPDGFAEVLLEHGCLTRIVQVVELQLTRQAFQEG